MITMKLRGGMGNQMFQCALGLVLAELNGSELSLDISAYPDSVGREYFLGCFPVNARLVGHPGGAPNIKEKDFTFDPAIPGLRGSFFLDGYWQSEKYFMDHEDLIRKCFSFKSPPKNQDSAKRLGDSTSVGVHIRRGDMASNPHTFQYHGLMDKEYYDKAYELIKLHEPAPEFFIFTDSPEWPGLGNLEGRAIEGDTHEHLQLMSMCQHFIVGNSTFSWWGAWLSQRGGLKIAPKKWFNQPKIDTRDLIPEKWTRI